MVTMDPAIEATPIRHDVQSQPPGCGEIAFYVVPPQRPLNYGSALHASMIRWPDGRPAEVGETLRCGSCGRSLGGGTVEAQVMNALGMVPRTRTG